MNGIDFDSLIDVSKGIVVFGASSSGYEAVSYLNKKGYIPSYIFDNNENKWGTRLLNIEIVSPNKLREIGKETNIIIASIYIDEIYKQLRDYGFNNIFIFSNILTVEKFKNEIGRLIALKPETKKIVEVILIYRITLRQELLKGLDFNCQEMIQYINNEATADFRKKQKNVDALFIRKLFKTFCPDLTLKNLIISDAISVTPTDKTEPFDIEFLNRNALIKVFPKIDDFYCPTCGSVLKSDKIVFAGMRIFAYLSCSICDDDFLADFPVGHGVVYPFYYSLKNDLVFPTTNQNWYSDFMIKTINSIFGLHSFPYKYLKIKQKSRYVVILNCLDCYYGHSVLKLLNADYYLEHCKEIDLVVIVPKYLTWMVPNEIENLIEVDIPMREGYKWIIDFSKFVNEFIFRNYDYVYISKAYSHPHPKDYNIQKFLKCEPFDLNLFQNENKSSITFIWREDRIIGYDLFEQGQYVTELYNRLNSIISNLDFAVVGLGTNYCFPNTIKDLRTDNMTYETEKIFCERYSQSKVVIGVHGSNMLIPSALAGSVVELLPDDRLGNYLQDILFNRYQDSRDVLFRYRFLPINTSIDNVASTVCSIITNYSRFKTNMLTNIY